MSDEIKYKDYPPTEQQKLSAIVGIEEKLIDILEVLRKIATAMNWAMNKPTREECEREVDGMLSLFQQVKSRSRKETGEK